MRDLGIAALKTIARDAIFEDDFAPLEEVFVGPKPPTVPDHLGALFAPLSERIVAGDKPLPATPDELTDELTGEPDFIEELLGAEQRKLEDLRDRGFEEEE